MFCSRRYANMIDINHHLVSGEKSIGNAWLCCWCLILLRHAAGGGREDRTLISSPFFCHLGRLSIASSSALFEAACKFTSSLASLPPHLSSSPSLFSRSTCNQVEGIRAASQTRGIHTENIRATSVLRGQRGSHQGPVCSCTVPNVAVMYCQKEGL